MAELKRVTGLYEAAGSHWVGDGFPVQTVFPSHGIADLDPFLMLDYAGPVHFDPASQPRGVGQHPHRGFETVTIAYQGSVDHPDSAGNAGSISPGDVQWMTAASGVLHEEMHGKELTESGGNFEMAQLWVNLPAASKMSEPGYQTLLADAIPRVEFGPKEGPEAYARVIAGELHGVHGPAKTFTPVNVLDVRMEAGSNATLTLPAGQNSAVILLRGDVTVGGTSSLTGTAKVARLSPSDDTVTIEAKADSLLLVLSGEPLREPIASYGPFVMNTDDELRQAFEDYRAGRMGRIA